MSLIGVSKLWQSILNPHKSTVTATEKVVEFAALGMFTGTKAF
jgi:hypothetical protein